MLVGGRPTMSCVTPVPLVDGPVETSEGLVGESRELREEFAERGAFQCGFCTPGHVVHATALLREGRDGDPDEMVERVRDSLSGNICRCTGYAGIVSAVCAVARGAGGEASRP